MFHPNPTQMKNLFHRVVSLVMRYPRACAFLVLALVVTAPRIAEAQGGYGACYSAGYGEMCQAGDAAGAANALTIFGVLLYVTWYLLFWP